MDFISVLKQEKIKWLWDLLFWSERENIPGLEGRSQKAEGPAGRGVAAKCWNVGSAGERCRSGNRLSP